MPQREARGGLSPRTLQSLPAVLRRALNQPMRWGLVERNVATLVETPNGPRHVEERLLAGPAWRDHRLVFTTAQGKPLDARNAVRAFHGLLRRAGLPDMRVHDLRHTCSSLLLAQGVHPRFVMDLLGHAQISLTMDTYRTVLPALTQDVADRTQSILAAEG
jgi:integrase